MSTTWTLVPADAAPTGALLAGHPEKGSIKSPTLDSSATSHGDGVVESWSYSLL